MKSIGETMKEVLRDIKTPENEGDFIGEDGFLHCGKCGSRKQTKINVMGKELKTPKECDCEREAREKREKEEQDRAHRRMVDRNRRRCFRGSSFEHVTFGIDDGAMPKITQGCQSYCSKFQLMMERGKGLLFYGSTGTGKSSYAAMIANELLEQGYSVLYTSIAELAGRMHYSFQAEVDVIEELRTFDLVILDDLKTERTTSTMAERAYKIVNTLNEAKKPFICTTNISIEEIKNPEKQEDRRLFDRVLQRCMPVEVEGVQRRRKEIAADYSEMKDLLGF